MAASTTAAASSGAPTQSDEDRYFSTNPPPKDLEQHMALVEAFVDKHAKVNRRIVLVTSGGTTVSASCSYFIMTCFYVLCPNIKIRSLWRSKLSALLTTSLPAHVELQVPSISWTTRLIML